MKKRISISVIKVIVFLFIFFISYDLHAYRVHCEEDSLKVMEIISDVSQKGGSLGERIVVAAPSLEGIPFAEASDNDSVATIMVNLHGLDRFEFLNNVIAIAKTSEKIDPTFRDYVGFYESLSRRKGEDTGFSSRLFYGADWIVDNVFRGNVKEMTEYLTGGGFKTKTFDYISRHSDEFPAMKDSATVEKIKMVEMGYRSHRIPHLKKQSAGNKSLHELMHDGDIIFMLAPEMDYDIYDIGIVEMKDGVPYLTHLPVNPGSVTSDPYPMARLFKLDNQHFYGYRWLRATE